MLIDKTRLPVIVFYDNENCDIYYKYSNNTFYDYYNNPICKEDEIDIKSIIYLDELQEKFPDNFKE